MSDVLVLCVWFFYFNRVQLPRLNFSVSMSTAAKPAFTVPPTSKIFESTNPNPKIFRVITIVSGIQFVLWCYLSYFALTQLNSVGKKPDQQKAEGSEVSGTLDGGSRVQQKVDDSDGEREESSGQKIKTEQESTSDIVMFRDAEIVSEELQVDNNSAMPVVGDDTVRDSMAPVGDDSATPETGAGGKPKLNKSGELIERLMSSKWRVSLSLLSLSAGAVFAMVAYIYPLRMVRGVTYIRPSQLLEVVTHSPWGTPRTIQVPLVDVVCNTTPAQVAEGQVIALKIKNYQWFFLLNHKGITIDPMFSALVLSRRNHSN